MNNITSLLFKLIAVAVDGWELDGGVSLSENEEKQLYSLSAAHDLAHLVAYALDKNNITVASEQISEKFKNQQMLSILRYERQRYEIEEISLLFNSLKIPFILLKGAVIRTMYPEPWMRTGCDIDILVNESDLTAARDALLEKMGYSVDALGNHDISFTSQSGVRIELHFSLLDNRNEDRFLKNVWKYAKQKEAGSFEYLLPLEAFYYYHIYHMAKHFMDGGCGIKPFLDLWMMKKTGLSLNEIGSDALRRGGLYRFAVGVQSLSRVWFESGSHTELTEKMEAYILGGGVYGSRLNKHLTEKKKRRSKLLYNLSRVWLSPSEMKLRYPKLEKHVWLLPFYQVKRWCSVFSRRCENKKVKEQECERSADDLVSYLIKSLEL